MNDDLPTDLVPLPTAPYPERPAALPLDVEECRTALWLYRGNVSEAAARLKVSSSRLRAFVRASAYLTNEADEARQRLKDVAEDIVYEALTDETDAGRRDSMARFVLTNLGDDRGYGNKNGKGVTINAPNSKFTIQWEDGSSFDEPKSPPNVIEGDVV
jgi:hypothetical protein